VPESYKRSSGPIPPNPPARSVNAQQPEIIVPARVSHPSRSGGRERLSSIPPRELLDEAAAVAIEQQHMRRNRVVWTIAGTVLALILLWTQLKSRAAESTPEPDVTLLPALLSLSGSAGTGSVQSAGIQVPEPAPIDLDSDELARPPQLLRRGSPVPVRTEPRASAARARANGLDESQRNTAMVRDAAGTPRTELPSGASEAPAEPLPALPRHRAWFPED